MLQLFAMEQIGHGNTDWLILQLADSAFPAGGFAHSGGLEAAWQLGAVRDASGSADYLSAQMLQIARSQIPFVKLAHDSSAQLETIDADCHAFLNNPVARRASIAQGQAFAMAASKAFNHDACKLIATAVRRRQIHGHWSPVFGALTAAMQIDVTAAARLYLFINTRGVMSAAVRLGIVGPLEAQAIQFSALNRAIIPVFDEEPAQSSPMLDLWQGVQDRLYSRLFQS